MRLDATVQYSMLFVQSDRTQSLVSERYLEGLGANVIKTSIVWVMRSHVFCALQTASSTFAFIHYADGTLASSLHCDTSAQHYVRRRS